MVPNDLKSEYLTNKFDDEFDHFRYELGDILKDVTRLVGTENIIKWFVEYLNQILMNENVDSNNAESMFSLEAIVGGGSAFGRSGST